jgi:hypothetical protein
MSKKESKQNPQNEEVDLGILFKAIDRLFTRIYNFFASLFKVIFGFIINILKDVVLNYKLILTLLVTAFIAGLIVQKTSSEKFSSSMLVKTYFNSKYELVSTTDYYNALIKDKAYEELSRLFKMDTSSVKNIISLAVEPGPETENQIREKYSAFIQALDTTQLESVTFQDFKDSRSIYDTDMHYIHVQSYQKDLFGSLGKAMVESFKNEYAEKEIDKRDRALAIKKNNILSSLEQVKSLQSVYLRVLENESLSAAATNLNFSDAVELQREKTQTKEFELFEQEVELKRQLSVLEEQQIVENTPLEIVANFQSVASVKKSFLEHYSLSLPLMVFFLISVIYFTKRIIKFVMSYQN